MSIGRLVALALLVAAPASASTFSREVCADPNAPAIASSRADRIWNVQFGASAPVEPRASLLAGSVGVVAADDQGTPRAKAIEYSHGYEVRMKVHKIASWAILPLFATEFILGQKLYDGTENVDSVKGAHAAVAGAIGGLFAVNTVTGVWNLWEARHDPNHRGRRLTHGIMMLGAGAGFVATGLLAPDDDNPNNYLDRRSTHRTVALTSMAVATASYVMMFFWK